ncbi:HD-GYP domain-containing protein [Piscinibacter terrae]|uniref:HD domain-containing protein n=1 Tax=Piscinibacter terrae TaxID=2496871 RepID=A0A3N7HMR0_9BURK|nr:hypothetical protein [Albitalea terrae]RQP21931.1 hypothetical protein DZC73_26210 [Albitalea terrae]
MSTTPESAESRTEPAAPGPALEPAGFRSSASAKQLVEAWQNMKMNFNLLMRGFQADGGWLARFEAMAERVRVLLAQDADAALYMTMQTAALEIEHYSAHHALHCAVVSHLCSGWLGWQPDERNAVFMAALSMNLGMHSMQDAMARQSSALSAEQRKKVDVHAQQSADLLQSAGVMDALWLEVVMRHHHPMLAGEAPDADPPARRLASLLHRVDVFTAKLSRRQVRAGTSATVAARDACLDESGYPDAIGATILRVLGLYPPGSFVELANGELAVVTRRGAKAHAPMAACLRRSDGTPMLRPARRDTSQRGLSVKRAVLPAELKMVVNHERVLAA